MNSKKAMVQEALDALGREIRQKIADLNYLMELRSIGIELLKNDGEDLPPESRQRLNQMAKEIFGDDISYN